MKDSLGDRIKGYENVSRTYLTKRTPVVVRVDGRAFHTFTKRFNKPFDRRLMFAMQEAAFAVAEQIQGFKAAYVQSDEATFVFTDYDDIKTGGWFDYNLNKIVSITAATMSVEFNNLLIGSTKAVFDSRAFNVPREDVINCLLWRAKDWGRNSLQMYCQSLFSHKELQGKKRPDLHEMLHNIGKNWAVDLTHMECNGSFIINSGNGLVVDHSVLPTYESIKSVIGEI